MFMQVGNQPYSGKRYGNKRIWTKGDKQREQNYICVEKDEAFQLSIKNVDPHDTNTYGAVLFLDGQRVHGKKTFISKTHFYGFKSGNGQYKEFIFGQPKMIGDQEKEENI